MSDSKEDYSDDFEVTPWKVEGSVDYARLIKKFGTQEITDELLEKLKSFTGELHPLLGHKFFFSHRDLDWILNKYENNEKFYLYTGRGPSGMVHLGHLMPWFLTKHLQDKFDSNLLFQITDDEKFLYGNKSMEEINRNVYENILDIIAIGFNKSKTKIIVNSKHIKHLYSTSLEIAKRITFSTAKSIFGFTNSTNIGMIGFPPLQGVPCFLPSILEGRPTPVLIPAAIDQDPYWRLTRDIAEKIGFYKPAQIHSKFLPSLQTVGKMSSSDPETAIFTTDDLDVIEKKISNTFTGGQPTISLQKKLGGNPGVCSVFSYLKYMFDTPAESNERELRCRSGNLLCGECKNDLSNHSTSFMSMFQQKREKAKDLVSDFMYREDR
ncbi:MAG TPA: tryptophan--tRNA ligase [Nitrososphaeraceae archaeon]|nr:tryptophan--tRNA ligase [Nitrososphaeraceae archaeon]